MSRALRRRTGYRDHTSRVPARAAIGALLRSVLVATTLVVLYFALPLTNTPDTAAWLQLTAGLACVAVVLGWQLLSVTRSPNPVLRGIETVATTFPLFLLLFATTTYLLEDARPGSYSEPMTRADALYFTVTVFATVGFGDITAVSQPARVFTTVQMVCNLLFVGVIAKVLVGAVQLGRARAEAGDVDGALPQPREAGTSQRRSDAERTGPS